MDANRWRRIEVVCDAALALPPAERPAYLDRECGTDADLRREVDSLLAHEATAERFLDAPAEALPPHARGIDLVGERFGEYEIAAKLGEGGMGEVYRAHDRALGRSVAIKILPADVTGDHDRLRRFLREARLLATVNHPFIGAIYGLIEINGAPALVLELVEGETLSAALARGPMAAPRALTIAAQVAEALDHAHRRGITHRDLKPANIMLTRNGVKLLDFGVGKWAPPGADATVTRPSTLTGEGAIVGTLHYMSPEQLEGRPADGRSDIFSFGAVLFEMLAGRKAFDGPSQASIIASVLQAPTPMLPEVNGAVKPPLERIIAKCLDKDPDERWQSARDLRDALNWVKSDNDGSPAAVRVRGSTRAVSVAAGVAAVIGLALVGWAASFWTRSNNAADTPRPIRFTVQPAEGRVVTGTFDISGDGTQLVYSRVSPGAPAVLEVRRLDRFDTFTIPGTERAGLVAFSPDGQWIAFVVRRVLKKARVSTEPTAITLVEDVGATFQITWPVDEAIYLVGRNEPIRRVFANGGPMEAITTIQKGAEVDHHGPELLPAGDALLFSVHSTRNRYSIAAQRLNSKEHKTIIESGFGPRLLSSGHLVFGRGSSLLAVPFDAQTLEVRGKPVTVMEHVSTDRASGISDARMSRNGTLVYLSERSTNGSVLVWVDRNGRETPLPIPAPNFDNPGISPDGRQIVFVADEDGRRDVFTYEIASGRLARLTQDGSNWGPTWTSDGRGILFGRDAGATSHLVLYRPNAATSQTLAESINNLWPTSASIDATAIMVTEQPPTDELFLSVFANNVLTTLAQRDRGWPRFARFSPDGRWIAYSEFVGGRQEIFIQGYPDAGIRRQITVDGGRNPVWRRDGKELYFKQSGGVFAVAIDSRAGLTWEQPRRLFDNRFANSLADWDVGPDGRFLMIKPGPVADIALPLNVVANWQAELAARLPITK